MRNASNSLTSRSGNQPLIALWATRILFDLGGSKNVDFGNRSAVATACQVDAPSDAFEDDDGALLAQCRQRHQELDKARPQPEGTLRQNLDHLGDRLGLNEIEKQILAFAILIEQNRPLDDTADMLGGLAFDQVVTVIATLLDQPHDATRAALAFNGRLARSGLLTLERGQNQMLRGHFNLLDEFAGILLDPTIDPQHLLSTWILPGQKPGLTLRDFPHLREELDVICRYLKSAARSNQTGVNVLLYGPPGTGKTELARVIARRVRLSLSEISTRERDGAPLRPGQRLKAFLLAQEFLRGSQRDVTLFDEIEDIFPQEFSGLFGQVNRSDGHKAWMNQLLEDNPTPSLWISNEISQMDPAYIRRFDYVLPVPVPPRPIRQRILRRETAGLGVSASWIQRASANDQLSPALINRARRVVEGAGFRGVAAAEESLERALANTLQAMGRHGAVLGPPAGRVPYRLDILNASADLEPLLAGLRRRPIARICLYGPPGTGKTAFGEHVAEAIGATLIIRRASDLLGPYVGQTEQKIAAMFAEAEQCHGVLLLDEADSFLRDRSQQRHGWEVSMVNEVLTRMERFQGVFICSTNLIDNLDPAAARRFDLKIRLDALRPAQAFELFKTVVAAEGCRLTPAAAEAAWERLTSMDGLTPGDFSTVLRRLDLTPEGVRVEDLLEGLAEEVAFRNRGQREPIGFAA
ncbi:MAG: AAA family ATPase [Gammaproteobacteria bacterium]|nr:AAA family ATPase [Gammaproteobacteria bacterium]